jgi:hypothetical protein
MYSRYTPPGLNLRANMVITEYPSHVERRRATDDPVVTGVVLEDRPRDGKGHCWDGRICDHPDHGAYSPDYGTIHVFR